MAARLGKDSSGEMPHKQDETGKDQGVSSVQFIHEEGISYKHE